MFRALLKLPQFKVHTLTQFWASSITAAYTPNMHLNVILPLPFLCGGIILVRIPALCTVVRGRQLIIVWLDSCCLAVKCCRLELHWPVDDCCVADRGLIDCTCSVLLLYPLVDISSCWLIITVDISWCCGMLLCDVGKLPHLSSNLLFSNKHPNKILHAFPYVIRPRCMPSPSQDLRFYYPGTTNLFKSYSFSMCSIPNCLFTSSLLGLNISLSTSTGNSGC
jgi:hypothetical protein